MLAERAAVGARNIARVKRVTHEARHRRDLLLATRESIFWTEWVRAAGLVYDVLWALKSNKNVQVSFCDAPKHYTSDL